MDTGHIESLWRYPVKSLKGEALGCVDIDSRGVLGDRLYAISNVECKLGSGKDTRRFKRIDGLFAISAETKADGLFITLPNGSVLLGNDPSINSMLSKTLGQSVTLTKESRVSHFDEGAIHILTTASLSLLQTKLPDSGIVPERFRPNIVIASQLYDQDLLGKVIRVGEVSLEVTHKTERCRMVTMSQGQLESRPDILKKVSQDFDSNFGVYAKVLSTGSISVSDNVDIFKK